MLQGWERRGIQISSSLTPLSRFSQSDEKALNMINLDDRLTCAAMVESLTQAEAEAAEQEDEIQAAAKAAEPAKKQQKTKK